MTTFFDHTDAPSPHEEEPVYVDASDPAAFDEEWWANLKEPDDLEPPELVARDAVAKGSGTVPLACLPEKFWNARPLFSKVRQYAHATLAPADAVMGAVLARASSMVSHKLKFDSGRGPTGSLNTFVALVAPSGVGKSSAASAAAAMILPPRYLMDIFTQDVDPEKFRDGVGLGTGEGLAEIYMGTAERDTGEVDKKGEPKTEKYRAQVRNNAFFYLDEGETLGKMMTERAGTTVGQTIRTAWVGDTMGQANAREETTRHIKRGSYSMGLLIGFQPPSAQSLLADGAGGTPQRFLWLSALDKTIPDDQPACPPPFALPLEDPRDSNKALEGVVQFPTWLTSQLRKAHLDKLRGEVIVEELDSHEPLMLCKLAALLCVLDGRMLVNEQDWDLAQLVWAVSCATRDRLIEFGKQEAAAKIQAKQEAKALEAQAVRLAEYEVDASVARVAKLIAKHVHNRADAGDEPFTKGAERKTHRSDDKTRYFDQAFDFAVAQGWISYDDDERLVRPGASRPAS